ncbi:MAG: DUF5682 family protein [Bacteroidia bacterium]|nr:DUF5682 family protein [Bacteroidia bacterium]
MSLHVLGIRHHGPGSAFHVMKALESLKPDIILVEGPPEGESILSWVSHKDMQPPVALLAYVPDNPQKAVFYPFATYSPEWNALKFAQERNIPVRFIDMPLSHRLAQPEPDKEEAKENIPRQIRRNPLSYLAEIAGFEDTEEWWEQQFELTRQPEEVFFAVADAMIALRSTVGDAEDESEHEKRREAFMRRAIRTAQHEMYSTIVVVCGAWHVPALLEMPPQKQDDIILKNLPKTKIETTWIPWTNERLSYESGYGAGIQSPGWYAHCWNRRDDHGVEWLTHTARVFRNHKIEISSAHIIETTRLAHALTQIRNFSKPGLKEYNESIQAVMCMGEEILMRLVWKELIVGHDMGTIPEGTPRVPLLTDFEKQIKTLRLKLSPDRKPLFLDLREGFDLQKSIFLHRLNTLDVTLGKSKTTRGKGTFKEEWEICWTPELHINLIEKAPWGNSIEMACNKYLTYQADTCTRLNEISTLLEKALPAELPDGVAALMQKLDTLAASSNDTVELMDTIIPLAHISRYGNVRKTDMDTVEMILSAVFYRMLIGLPLSATGIDEEQAHHIMGKISGIHQTIGLLNKDEYKNAWQETIRIMADNEQAAPLIQGVCHKILYESRYISRESSNIAFSKALSDRQNPNFAVNWLEGFLKDTGNLLILDDDIWNIVYGWVAALPQETFQELVPLLRRTFSSFNVIERRKIGEKVKHGKSMTPTTAGRLEGDEQRANRVIPIVEKLLRL